MITIAIARSDLVDAATFEALRASVPTWRRDISDAYYRKEDRYASVVSYALLQHLWSRRSTEPMPDIEWGRHGKPFFHDTAAWHFNWSHDASVCVCAFATVPVGVDVQSRVRYDDGLFDRMAAPAEDGLRDVLRRRDDLSSLWTRKEAVIKRTGRGLSTPLGEVDTLAEPSLVTFSCDEPDFRLSVCTEGSDLARAALQPTFRWVRPAPASATWLEAPAGRLSRVSTRPPVATREVGRNGHLA